MIEEKKLEKISNIRSWQDCSKHHITINKAINEEFALALKSGAIRGLVIENEITVSKEWLIDVSGRNGFRNSRFIDSFWEKVIEVSGGKKICLTPDDYHRGNYYYDLEDFLNKEFTGIEDELVFGALLDMDKTTKYFSKKSVEDLTFNIGDGEVDEYFGKHLKSILESAGCDSIKMPDGWNKWMAKMNKSNPSLVKPTNKIDLIVWKKQMKDIKITAKNYESFIQRSLSRNESLLNVQTAFISQIITKGTMNTRHLPKWAKKKMMDSYSFKSHIEIIPNYIC